ncbi:hypothetical protein [Hymenobacter sp. IS2118]|uniref:hypothetical protein n=1 Tax=Hymenobacter sp. IS2118 TaxID=1505605 RepID=UPI0012682764|nr:hypothetical protein [Hymenobacter sp. IS2118]
MFRILISSLVLLVAAADVSAQTTPANAPPAAPNNAATRSASKTSAVPASNTSETYITSDGVRDSAGLKIQNVYAAPGMPVIIKNGPVGPYDGKAAELEQRKSRRRGNSTLSPKKP